MKRLACLFLFLFFMGLIRAEDESKPQEWIVVTGGCALRFMEHGKAASHDEYWFNFIDASVIRWQEIRSQAPATAILTWLVYQPAYQSRETEMGVDLLGQIQAKADKAGVRLFWFKSREELINYLNRGFDRDGTKVANFDYFGHSNKACFLFDYSNQIDGLSIDNLHIDDLHRISAGIFARNATCKSWGCHSGELYSQWWKQRFDVAMIGAVGKTDFSQGGTPVLANAKTDKWTQ